MPYHAVAWGLLSLGFLFVAFEEVSWFERVTHVSIEAIKTQNVQHETTIHNLSFVQPYLCLAYVVVSAVAAFGWIVFPNSFIFPDRILCLYFLPLCVVYSCFEAGRLFNGGELLFGFSVWRDQEPVETLMALGFLLHAVLILYVLKMRARHPAPGTEGASAAVRP